MVLFWNKNCKNIDGTDILTLIGLLLDPYFGPLLDRCFGPLIQKMSVKDRAFTEIQRESSTLVSDFNFLLFKTLESFL